MHTEPIGVYPIIADEPCHLIELWLRGCTGPVNFGDFTQELPGRARENWQVAYDEWLLNSEGTAGALAPIPGPVEAASDIRVAFFFHYLDPSRPIMTPGGAVALPKPVARPDRLSFIEYEPPG